MAEAGGLLERDRELGLIGTAIAGACQGAGAALVVAGQAGIGKTALCRQACERARAAGVRVLWAAGSPIEHDYSYGVVRQLFEPWLRQQPPGRRARVLSAAGAAAGIVTGDGPDLPGDLPPDRVYAVLHGLHRLTAALASRSPLLIAADDAQWADLASQRYLAYVARRLETMRVVLLAAIRQGEPGPAGPLAELASMDGVTVLCPAPLSSHSVAALVVSRLGPPEPAFTAACLQASGGVPFYLRELLDSLAREGVQPAATAAGKVTATGPGTVAGATLRRLARLGAAATAVARAVAVLGPHADPARVAALTGLPSDEVLASAARLAASGIFASGGALGFAHPIVGTAMYRELPAGARDRAHRDAARLLAAEGADAEEVAAHLLATTPRSAGDIRAGLRAAAARATARAAPDSAVAYLRRLLAETPHRRERVGVLHELGRAEALISDPQAARHLRQAHAEAGDPCQRAAIARDLADALGASGEWDARIPLIREALAELPRDSPLALQLERRQAGLEAYDVRFAADFDRRAAARRRLIDEGHPGSQALALLFAAVAAWRGHDRQEVAALVRRGLAGGAFLAREGSASPSLPQAAGALLLTEDLAGARALIGEMFADAARRGSVFGRLQAHSCRAWLRTQEGDLAAAEEDLLVAAGAARESGDLLALVSVLRFGMEALAERPGLASLAAAAEETEVGPGWDRTLTGGFLLETRGYLRLEAGDAAGAVGSLRASGAIYQALRMTAPALVTWQSCLARALPAGEEADALAAAALAAARASGLPRAVSRALRTAGLLHGGEQGIGLLRHSVTQAQRCPSPLEEARSQVELGAALRRSGRPASARQPLAAGLELAGRCGAQRLAARALAELRLAGARPRRLAISGPAALTPAEERVARLAAGGLTNAGIARVLCVTPKTVENQLGSVYRKLQVSGRGQLAAALGARVSSAARRDGRADCAPAAN